MNNFHYAQTLLDMLYGLDIDDDMFEEIALIGWGLIGNKRTRLYRQCIEINKCNQEVLLPCNLEQLEAVTTDHEEWASITNSSENGDYYSDAVETATEASKRNKSPLYAPGKFVKYERVGDNLYFDQPYGKINILYKGLIADEDGLPELTDKEATALATYCAYVLKFKEGVSTNNSALLQMAQVLKQTWNVQCDQARVDHYMSQNEWDEVLDAKNSWNRKQYNKSLKLYR